MKLALRAIVALGLLVNAYIHLDLASQYDAVTSGTISQGDLFRVEAGRAARRGARRRAAPAGLRPVRTGRCRWRDRRGDLYRYVDVGPIGPLPSMYEPVWYAEKTLSLVAQAVAAAAAATLLVLGVRQPEHGGVDHEHHPENRRQHRVPDDR